RGREDRPRPSQRDRRHRRRARDARGQHGLAFRDRRDEPRGAWRRCCRRTNREGRVSHPAGGRATPYPVLHIAGHRGCAGRRHRSPSPRGVAAHRPGARVSRRRRARRPVSADLTRARTERGEVVRVERLGSLIELTVTLPWLAATAAPGQFAQLRCGDGIEPLLRRPFSVAWTENDRCGFVFEEVGAGTRLLAALRPGDTLDVLGPLGTGFDVETGGGPVVCVSGGVGCAPFPLLIAALRERGAGDITVLSGAATASRLYPAERFARGIDGV